MTAALCRLLAPIQKEYQESAEWQEVRFAFLWRLSYSNGFPQINKKAYPEDAPKEKKKKKDKGSRHPGAKAAVQAEEGKDMSKEPATEADVGKSAADAMDKLAV